jgi:chaperonin GroEL
MRTNGTRRKHRRGIASTDALAQLHSGMDQLASLLALTFGPRPGVVVNARSGTSQPELLTDSGVIARRVTQLPGLGPDAGAMLLRNMVFRVHEHYGDGAATAAILARALTCEASKFVAAGANPMRLRAGLQRGLVAARAALQAQARPVRGKVALARLARAITNDAELADVLGEMFDLLGQHAAITIQEYYSPSLEREYLDGGRWTARPAGRGFLPEGQPEVALENPRILVTDQSLTTVEHVRAVLELAVAATPTAPLLIIAPSVTGEALTTLLTNHVRGALNLAAVVPAANLSPMADELSDIALMTGARLLSEPSGRPTQRMQREDFGMARRAMLTRTALTLVAGAGQTFAPAAIQGRITELRRGMSTLNRTDQAWETLRLRAARLSGGVGILKIGAHTERERDARKEAARKAVCALDQALESGVVPGGGVAYLNAATALTPLREACDDADERNGVAILTRALEAPFLQLARNAGCVHPPLALANVRARGATVGLDARTSEYVDVVAAGLLDPLAVVVGALEAAVSTASMAITTGLIVFTGRRSASLKP